MCEVTGTILVIEPTVEVGSNNFKKRDVVVKTDDQYPQTLLIQFVQERTVTMDKFSVGDSVKIDINLRGREWTNPEGETKYFNTIQGWRIVKDGENAGAPAQAPAQASGTKDDEDDLPF